MRYSNKSGKIGILGGLYAMGLSLVYKLYPFNSIDEINQEIMDGVGLNCRVAY
jgi:hypothetical protein